jgi:hypothetical protein
MEVAGSDGALNAVTTRIVAKSGSFSDGEENILPVLTNRMMVIETMPMTVGGGQTKTFTFKDLQKATQSSSLRSHSYTLEFTQNPAWYAVQSLPYLMEYPYECSEQLFSRLYANSLAWHVASANPKIREVFDQWKGDKEALLSNLSKNQELKYVLREETPWVLAALKEEEQKRNVGLLFDLNRMAKEKDRAIAKLAERQDVKGGFSWFPGGRPDWYITQYIAEGFGHLNQLKVKIGDSRVEEMARRAVAYCDKLFLQRYKRLAFEVEMGRAKWEDDHLDYMDIHYLYMRSFFPTIAGVPS